MPAFHILLTGWVHLFGDSERAVRSINLPFAALFLGSIVFICRQAEDRLWWARALPFAFFPMLTYYVNECRPYTALLGLSAAAAAALLSRTSAPSKLAWWCASSFALAAFSMHQLGVLTPIVLLLFFALDKDYRQMMVNHWRDAIPALAATLAVWIFLLVYYVHIRGAGFPRGLGAELSETPGAVTSSWKNLVFFFYETLGFSGLGPPRNDMRIHATVSTFLPYLWWMLPGLILCGLLGCLFWRLKATATSSQGLPLAYASMLGVMFLFAIARLIHFGFFGRHAMSIIGMLCCSVAFALSNSSLSVLFRNATALALCLVWGLSSLRLLVLYPYGKDDARTALRVAEETHRPILWNGDQIDAAYYDAVSTRPRFDIWLPATYPGDRWQPRTVLVYAGWLRGRAWPAVRPTAARNLHHGERKAGRLRSRQLLGAQTSRLAPDPDQSSEWLRRLKVTVPQVPDEGKDRSGAP